MRPIWHNPMRPIWLMLPDHHETELAHIPSILSSILSLILITYCGITGDPGSSWRRLSVHAGKEPIEVGEKGGGFEVGKNQYLLIEDDELDAVTIESNHTIEIDSFVPREQMDERYLDSPYSLVPNEPDGQEAFAVIRDAMRGKDVVALGRIVLGKRERVVMLQPWDKGLVGTTLRYPHEVRRSSGARLPLCIRDIGIPSAVYSLTAMLRAVQLDGSNNSVCCLAEPRVAQVRASRG